MRHSLSLGCATLILAAAFPAAARVIAIEVKGLGFSPASVTVQVGDTLEWSNKDFVAHTATAKDKAWDIVLPAHGKGSVTLKTAAHIAYYCKYHPMMTGDVEVSPAP